jgi:hypothetical protein
VLSARGDYFSLLIKNQLLNVLDEIDIGYSKKLSILKKLLDNYSTEEINYSFNIYKKNYVSVGKYNIPFLYNTLSGIINRNRRKINETTL